MHVQFLENPSSLALFGFVCPAYQEMLVGNHAFEPEKLMARMWEGINETPSGSIEASLPMEVIIHEIAPRIINAEKGLENSKQKRLFEDLIWAGKPYAETEVSLVSSVILWFATGIGWQFSRGVLDSGDDSQCCFVEKFFHRGDCRKLTETWVHICSRQCEEPRCIYWCGTYAFIQLCQPDFKAVTSMHQALIRATLLWIGSCEGREFLLDFKREHDKEHSDYWKRKGEGCVAATT